jgi:hypothetical protein
MSPAQAIKIWNPTTNKTRTSLHGEIKNKAFQKLKYINW